ncbi:hypothetical protein B0H14DRAFT_2655746 [Mycena olivaceomarginata]|nr:hypothetical protein B0H14DRAFT_2655746 [Mycena olivaceomarginata]
MLDTVEDDDEDVACNIDGRQGAGRLKAFGTSGDGTTIRHINFEAKHVTYTKAGEDTPVTRMLDITSAPNHTSAAQLAGWKQIMRYALVDTYNASPLGQADPIDLDEFITWLTSLGTDHANDQLLLAKLKRGMEDYGAEDYAGKEVLGFNRPADVSPAYPIIQRRQYPGCRWAGFLECATRGREDTAGH